MATEIIEHSSREFFHPLQAPTSTRLLWWNPLDKKLVEENVVGYGRGFVDQVNFL